MPSIRKYLIPCFIVFCALLVALWILMSWASRRPYESFALTPEKFATFHPALEGWTIRALPIKRDDLIDANIAAYSLVPNEQAEQLSVIGSPLSGNSTTNNKKPITNNRLLTRLVHGYNMPMCMKMKYYTVEKILDHKVRPVTDPKLQSAFRTLGKDGGGINHEEHEGHERKEGPQGYSSLGELSDLSGKTNSIALDKSPSTFHLPPPTVPPSYPIPIQLWRLTSSAGTVSIWATTMIRSDDFSPTEVDICSMAFPRIEIPDDPNWVPRGLALDDLKNPRAAFMSWFHSRWDGARWDVLTFLRLRQPARTSEELLSYVTLIEGLSDNDDSTMDIRKLLEVHAGMLKEMQGWRRSSDRVSE